MDEKLRCWREAPGDWRVSWVHDCEWADEEGRHTASFPTFFRALEMIWTHITYNVDGTPRSGVGPTIQEQIDGWNSAVRSR
jgi:hypothetical protein